MPCLSGSRVRPGHSADRKAHPNPGGSPSLLRLSGTHCQPFKSGAASNAPREWHRATCVQLSQTQRTLTCRAAEVGGQTSSKLRTTLGSEEVAANVRFGRAALGKKNQFAIVVSYVEAGSTAEQEGLRVGQKLVAISSPMQSGSSGEMWDINEKPSLRFVRDAIRMRRTGSIILELTSEPVLQDLDQISEDLPQSSLLESIKDDADERTVGEKLAEAQRENEAKAAREESARKRRIQKRRDYMEREASRNNLPFFIGAAAFILLPSIAILGYAFSSGLLDRIGNSYRPY